MKKQKKRVQGKKVNKEELKKVSGGLNTQTAARTGAAGYSHKSTIR